MLIWLLASIDPTVPWRCTSRTSTFGSWRWAIRITAPYGPFKPGKGVVMFAFRRVGSRYSTELQPGIHDCRTAGLRIALKTCQLLALNLCEPLNFMKPFLTHTEIQPPLRTAFITERGSLPSLYCSGNCVDFQGCDELLPNIPIHLGKTPGSLLGLRNKDLNTFA